MNCVVCQSPSENLRVCGQCISKLVLDRTSYAYPAVHVEMIDDTLLFNDAARALSTSIALDDYHSGLLRSVDDNDRVLGILSVMYWGFYSHGDAFARNRVSWLLSGNARTKVSLETFGVARTVQVIRAAEARLDRGDIAGALIAVSDIPWFGQVSFASKLVAFLSPESAAIYDKGIEDSFTGTTLQMASNAGGVTAPKARTYADYCGMLNETATALNHAIDNIATAHWQERDQSLHCWRALDVERALFATL